jgi:hypothetical protein
MGQLGPVPSLLVFQSLSISCALSSLFASFLSDLRLPSLQVSFSFPISKQDQTTCVVKKAPILHTHSPFFHFTQLLFTYLLIFVVSVSARLAGRQEGGPFSLGHRAVSPTSGDLEPSNAATGGRLRNLPMRWKLAIVAACDFEANFCIVVAFRLSS